jgi:ABC-2 type transport system ATP-binding protein
MLEAPRGDLSTDTPAPSPAPVEPPPAPIQLAAVLRTRGLTRSFGKVRAVDAIDLDVPQGAIYGFLGRNGAGKTTTLRMLMGVLRPDRGEIELLGRSSVRIRPDQKRHIGYVSQEQFFYPWMTAERLGDFVGSFYPSWNPSEFRRLLATLDVPPKRKAIDLSGGTRTKLALALALAHRPALLLLDEPTSGLDPVARREFLEILSHEGKRLGQTAVFSSHLVDEVQFVAQRVGILDQGRLLYQGPIDALLERARRVTWHRDLHQLPPGFRAIRPDLDLTAPGAVLDADPSAWTEHAAAFASVERLSLEDVFLAMVRTTAVPPA